jgi:uncharacterized protein YlxW (UPF0749 family)
MADEAQDDVTADEAQDALAVGEARDDSAGAEARDGLADADARDDYSDAETPDDFSGAQARDGFAGADARDGLAGGEARGDSAGDGVSGGRQARDLGQETDGLPLRPVADEEQFAEPADADTSGALPAVAGAEEEPGDDADENAAGGRSAEDGSGEGGSARDGSGEGGSAEDGSGEGGSAADAGSKARAFGWSRSPAALLVGLLIGLLGFGLAVQVRSNTSTSGLPAARQEDLVRILDDLSSREDRLRRQIADLEAARTRLSTTGDTTSTALEEARKRSDALGILAGTVPAQGPGIVLTLTDPTSGLAAEDLLDTVEELRAAGAEAIQVGGVRIGLDSSFTAVGRGIAVDGVAVTAPYTILAIGDPPTLATAMQIPGGVSDTAKRAGGDAQADQRQQVVIRALRAIRTPRYSQPTN